METTTNSGRTLTLAFLTCLCILAPAIQVAGQSCIPPPSGLVSWWPLNETAGTIAADIIGGHNGDHVNNPTPEPGKVGGALAFHGISATPGPESGDFVRVADDPAWAFGNGNFTMGGWVKVEDTAETYILVSQSFGGRMQFFYGGLSRGLGFGLLGGTVNFGFDQGTGSGWSNGVYRHFALVRQSSLWTLYVDGQDVASTTVTNNYPDLTGDLMFGFQEDGSGGQCQGEGSVEVSIDIKPGSHTNSINLKSKGVNPVAILGSTEFSAITEIDVSTLRFGPEGAEPGDGAEAEHLGHVDDVNGDGILDAVIHFRTQDTGIELDDTVACVTGTTVAPTPEDATPIEGCDDIRITPGSSRGRGR